MAERRLKRQLSLLQVVMLGTAGTIAAGIFVLTGYAAGIVGPASVLALATIGLLSYSVALNYCELATTFPVTGGAMTYVREAWGTNLLSFLVGSLDCLSSTFFSALSAVGFAYSLRVFIPSLPIVPVAITVALVFTALNILGVNSVGNVQIILGGVLLALLSGYVILGFVLPHGFHWETFAPGGTIFIYQGFWENLVPLLATIALIYNVYIGFEVIADDAEEIKDPTRTIPSAILISLTVIALTYVLVVLVTLGTIPWQKLAWSKTAITDAANLFLPDWGAPLMAIAGIIATLTTVNTAMLSATREALTLSRDGAWPHFMSRLGRLRTPHAAILVVGTIICGIAAVGLVDFLSYISSSGYLFVLFWASLAMIRLRKLRPDLARPFRTPLFPLTAYIAAGTCLLIIVFTEWRALLFGACLLAVLTVFYYLRRPVAALLEHLKAAQPSKDRILVPVANPHTAESLVRLATILAQASEDTSICLLTVVPAPNRSRPEVTPRFLTHLDRSRNPTLSQAAQIAQSRNAPFYTKMRAALTVSQGILDEVEGYGNDKLILMGWPGPLTPQSLPDNPVNVVLRKASTNIAVLLDRGWRQMRNILVPIGGGPHSRLALRLAYEIAEQEGAQVVTLYCFCKAGEGHSAGEVEEMEDELSLLREIIENELGNVPACIATRVVHADSVPQGILAETGRQSYDLVVMGASAEWTLETQLFGSVDDRLATQVPCSLLLVRRHEPAAIVWVRRQAKWIERSQANQMDKLDSP